MHFSSAGCTCVSYNVDVRWLFFFQSAKTNGVIMRYVCHYLVPCFIFLFSAFEFKCNYTSLYFNISAEAAYIPRPTYDVMTTTACCIIVSYAASFQPTDSSCARV